VDGRGRVGGREREGEGWREEGREEGREGWSGVGGREQRRMSSKLNK